MRTRTIWIAALAILAVTAPARAERGARGGSRASLEPRPGLTIAPTPRPARPAVELGYRVTAGAPRVNRREMGPVRRVVQGVPAEPIDSMCWNGDGSTPIEGSISIEVQPMTNTGVIKARWVDRHGAWTFSLTRFIHPDHHSSGVRFGPSVDEVDTVLNEPIAHNVYLHGDTGAGMPVLPTVYTYLAAWGPATVTLNGEAFENPFEIPAPQWDAHLMVTEGVRRPDGTVRTLSGEIYNPSHARDGDVEEGDLEVHLTFHDDLYPRTNNVPPLFSFFYHLVFEDVKIELIQGDGAP